MSFFGSGERNRSGAVIGSRGRLGRLASAGQKLLGYALIAALIFGEAAAILHTPHAQAQEDPAPPRTIIPDAGLIRLISGRLVVLPRDGGGGGEEPEPEWTPLDLEPFAFWDPSDTATLFQDSSCTTPVTAHNDPVGCVLDKSVMAAIF